MKNLLREEFYKSNKGITQYICLGVAFLSLIFTALIYGLISGVQNRYHWIEFQAEIPLLLDFSGFIAVFVMVYICNEFSQKTIKNYVTIGFSRNSIYFAKLIKVGVITFVMLFILHLISLLFTPFVFKGTFVDLGENLVYYLYSLLILIECVCVYVAIGFFARNIGVVIGFYFGIPILISIIDSLSNVFLTNPILDFLSTFFKYSTVQGQQVLAEQIAFGGVPLPLESIILLVVPILISFIATLGSLIIFNKTDIK